MPEEYPRSFKEPDLRTLSIEARTHSVHSRILLAFTYCRLVRTELEYEQIDAVRKLLRAIEETVESVRTSLANATDLPAVFVAELTAELLRLEQEFTRVKREAEVEG